MTVGTPDANQLPVRSSAFARLVVHSGDQGSATDEADVTVTIGATDVRHNTTFADFEGTLDARLTVIITDRWNGTGADAATVVELPLVVPLSCGATAGAEGAVCAASTSVDALAPGAAREGARAIWALGAAEVRGPDGAPFLRPGVFVP